MGLMAVKNERTQLNEGCYRVAENESGIMEDSDLTNGEQPNRFCLLSLSLFETLSDLFGFAILVYAIVQSVIGFLFPLFCLWRHIYDSRNRTAATPLHCGLCGRNAVSMRRSPAFWAHTAIAA